MLRTSVTYICEMFNVIRLSTQIVSIQSRYLHYWYIVRYICRIATRTTCRVAGTRQMEREIVWKKRKKNMVAAVFWSGFSCVHCASHTKYSWYGTAYLGHCSILESGNTVKPQKGPATLPPAFVGTLHLSSFLFLASAIPLSSFLGA